MRDRLAELLLSGVIFHQLFRVRLKKGSGRSRYFACFEFLSLQSFVGDL